MTYSIILENRTTQDVSGFRGNSVSLVGGINPNPTKKNFIKLSKVVITKNIPNIYNFGTFNNTTIYITKDNWTTTDTINLTEGLYSIYELNLAIQTAMDTLGYFTAGSTSGFYLGANSAVNRTYIQLDSTNLAVAGQLGIDFSPSQIWYLLGFDTVRIFNTDGTHQADADPHVEGPSGTIIDVVTNLTQNTKYLNGQTKNIICSVPLSNLSSSKNEYVYPSDGVETPILPLDQLNNINTFTVDYTNSDGEPVYFGQGTVLTEVVLILS